MKRVTVAFIAGLFAFTANAQILPTTSPLGKVEQKVGVTQIGLEYSRPSVKERTIYGDLVPYDEMWRLGANAATKIDISTPITIQGKQLPAGKYSMQAIPSANGNWVIIFNSDANLSGLTGYDEAKDVMRVNATAKPNSFTESLYIGVDNITHNSGAITIQWEKLRVDVPFTVDTDNLAVSNIEKAIKEGKNLDEVYAGAAGYFSGKGDSDKALDYANKSIKIKKSYRPLFIKAGILQKNGDTKQAITTAEEAEKLAREANAIGFADFMQKTIADWKK